MPIDPGEELGELRSARLQLDLSESRARVPEPVTRDAHDQSLDDAPNDWSRKSEPWSEANRRGHDAVKSRPKIVRRLRRARSGTTA